MRWLILILIFFAGVGLSIYGYKYIAKPQTPPHVKTVTQPTSIPSQSVNHVETTHATLFVPYWQLAEGDITFPSMDAANKAEQKLVYFGVAVDANGVTQSDQGYQSLSLFLEKAPKGMKKYLGVRMTDHEKNQMLLADSKAQSTIVNDVVSLAHDRGFDGVLLDLELAPTFNSNLPAQINTFIDSFFQKSHEQNLKFALTLYGDTFYRKRPYDVAHIKDRADEIMIMAYDLHKPGGEPGPNFPLQGKESFGYDMETMAADFAGIPPEKLTIIYGMFGYDWVVDENKRPIRPATSITAAQVKSKYSGQCDVLHCLNQHDKNAKESVIEVIDKQLLYHIVWSEDMDSVKAKTAFLNDHGIGSIGFWAAGYY